MRAAVIGLGAVSFEHLAKLNRMPGVEVVAVCDIEPLLAAAVADRFGVPGVHTDVELMLSETRPDVVHVLTPPKAHREVAGQALRAGAHVLVEKPVAPTWNDYVAIRELAHRHDRLLVENYNWRCQRVVRRALAMVASGDIGRVVAVRARFTGVMQPPDPIADPDLAHFAHSLPGGATQNFATHPVSLALAFAGRAESVQVLTRRLDPASRGSDELTALLSCERAPALVAVSKNARPGGFRLEVDCSKGTIEADLYSGRLHLDRSGGALARLGNDVRHGAGYLSGVTVMVAATLTGRRDLYEGLGWLVERLYLAIARGGEPPVSIEEMDAVNTVMRELFERNGPR